MTAMLYSIASVADVEVAVAQGVDVVDIADPSAEEWPAACLAEIVSAVAGVRRVSALAGDAAMRPDRAVASVDAALAAGVDFVRVALLPDRQQPVIAALAERSESARLVAVLFADLQRDVAVIVPRLAAAGFAGVMLDVADRDHGRLFDHAGIAELSALVRTARAHSLAVGLAGRLEVPDVPRLLALEPDLLGFRAPAKRAAVEPQAVARIRQLIPMERSEEAPDVDYRLLSARGQYPEPADSDRTLRVFVRDLVLPVRIGAYSHERDKPQDVRFDVTVEVPRGGEPHGMGEVFSYDLITDAISAIVAAEHIDFVETLAERVGQQMLRHPMVRRVAVKVEKLELGPGSVGVELTLDRPAAAAARNPILAMRADRRSAGGGD